MEYFLIVFLMLAGSFTAFWYWISHKTSLKGNLTQQKSPLIIFDFDGTIAPTYPLFIEQVNFLSKRYNFRKIRDNEIEDFRNMSPKEIMKTLGVSMFKLPFLLRRARRNIQASLLDMKPVEGIVEVINQFKQQGYSLGILTSNSVENVDPYLQKHDINVFDFIYAAKNIFGKEKNLRNIVQKNPHQHKIFYIGDETRDMEAAKKAGLISVGVAWGYNSLTFLQESHPDFICTSPSELLAIKFQDI